MKPDLSRKFQPDLFQSASNSTLSLQECNPDEIIRGKNSEFWELRPVLFPTGSKKSSILNRKSAETWISSRSWGTATRSDVSCSWSKRLQTAIQPFCCSGK